LVISKYLKKIGFYSFPTLHLVKQLWCGDQVCMLYLGYYGQGTERGASASSAFECRQTSGSLTSRP